MAARLLLHRAAAAACAGGPLLGPRFGLARKQHTAARCEAAEPAKWRRPLGGSTGTCDGSGVKFYAARSKKAPESAGCFAVGERIHHFAVVDGVPGSDGDGGAACAKFCAARLPKMAAHSFAERVRATPLSAVADDSGAAVADEAEAAALVWADALTAGFGMCDQAALNEAQGACGAMLCIVARSGVYVASVGLGRAVIGTEEPGGQGAFVDEASAPHRRDGEEEAKRLAAAGGPSELRLPPGAPTRQLGGLAARQAEPRLVGLPDVVRHEHSAQRRFVILGSPGLWEHGPRLPVQWAVEAYRAGRSPADELVARSRGDDVVALVLVLPPGLGEGDRLPAHDELA